MNIFRSCKCHLSCNEQRTRLTLYHDSKDIRDKYQYLKADMSKLQKVGYTEDFFTLEEGEDYVQNYLIPNKLYF